MNKMPSLTVLLLTVLCMVHAQDAKEIVKQADAKMKGEESSISSMTMQIIRPSWERSISFKNWTKGTEYSMVLITAPAKDKNQSFLKYKREMWSWNPTINRIIKMPPSMLSQGWMSSDFTNDDLLNESSVVVDYSHKLLGQEAISGRTCHKIELMPKEDAPVVWGKIILWISEKEYLQLKSEYYDEDGYLVKTEIASDIKTMDGRVIPTRFELIPADKQGQKTVITLESVAFNVPIADSFFSQQNMKKLH
jgi:outer membrane lipoprotein-sorting protein